MFSKLENPLHKDFALFFFSFFFDIQTSKKELIQMDIKEKMMDGISTMNILPGTMGHKRITGLYFASLKPF